MTQKAITKILQQYRSRVLQAGIPIDAMFLFGSMATNRSKKDSDIDVCVVSPQFGRDRQSERIELMRLRETIDDRIEPHPYNSEDFQSQYDPFARQIQQFGVKI